MPGADRSRSPVPPFGPLQGVRVLDCGRFVAGPWAGTYLGEFGAEVIHVEGPPFAPPYSDPTRSLMPRIPEEAPREASVSESWVQYSRNKLSLGLDIRTIEGRAVLLDLVKVSDIFIESSRPGTFGKMGLADESLWGANPRLTIVHVSGFGQTGRPERVRAPSYDLIGQAYSGYLSLQGRPDPDPPQRAGTALNDTVTGLAAATSALMGFISAQRTGVGQAVDVAQYEVFFTLLENLAVDYFERGVVRGRHGTAHPRLHPYDVFRSKDGWVVVAAPTPESWRRLRPLLGLEGSEWDEPTFREARRAEVDRAIASLCQERSGLELEAFGRENDVAVARVYDIADIARDSHYRDREMLIEWEDPVAGRVRGAGIAPKFSRTPGRVWRGAPWLGQDNAALLGGLLGYRSDRIQRLMDAGIVGELLPSQSPAPRRPPFFVREGL